MYHSEVYQTEKARKAALARKDAIQYALLCNALGIRSEDVEDFELQRSGAALIQEEQRRKSELAVQSRLNAGLLLKLTDYHGVNPGNIMEDTFLKRNVLKQAGYTSAYVGKGQRVSLEAASGARVGAMFKRVYETAQKSRAK